MRETSLPSAAFRERFNYGEAELLIQSVVRDIEYRLTGAKSRTHWVEEEFEMVYVSDGGMAARWSARTMALAQHYGIPTNGLDVTRSARFGWWFATHAFNYKSGKYTTHVVPERTPLHSRPVVYVLRSRHAVDLGDLEFDRHTTGVTGGRVRARKLGSARQRLC